MCPNAALPGKLTPPITPTTTITDDPARPSHQAPGLPFVFPPCHLALHQTIGNIACQDHLVPHYVNLKLATRGTELKIRSRRDGHHPTRRASPSSFSTIRSNVFVPTVVIGHACPRRRVRAHRCRVRPQPAPTAPGFNVQAPQAHPPPQRLELVVVCRPRCSDEQAPQQATSEFCRHTRIA